MKIKNTLKPEYNILRKEVREIQTLANSLDSKDPKQLETNLWNLESKISDLRSFIWNHLIRETKKE
jgi:hypothetical protein